MGNLYNLKGIVRLKCRLDCLFLHINDTRCDEDTIFLNMNRDLFLQHDDNVCQDVGNRNVVLLVFDLVLHCLIVDDVALYDLKLLRCDSVCFQILANGCDRIFIQIRSKYVFCAQF